MLAPNATAVRAIGRSPGRSHGRMPARADHTLSIMPVRAGPGRSIAIGAVTVGGVVSIVGMFAPWVRTGAASRSSFELADLVARLGYAPDGPIGLALRTWPMAPLSVVVAVVATWWIGGRVAAAIAVVVGLLIGLVGVAVWSAADSILHREPVGLSRYDPRRRHDGGRRAAVVVRRRRDRRHACDGGRIGAVAGGVTRARHPAARRPVVAVPDGRS